jgi:tetratricopeptide (TPR) repeat protein
MMNATAMERLEQETPPRHPPPGGLHPGGRRRTGHPDPVPEYHPSAGERLRNSIHRHRFGIGAGSAIVAALVLGIVGTTIGMVRASRQRDAALAARAEADRLRVAAETKEHEAESVNAFLEALLGTLNPWGADQPAEVSVEQMLDVATARLDSGSLKGQPEAEARVRTTLGQAYRGVALPARAEAHFRRALDLQKQLYPKQDHTDVARAMTALAGALGGSDPARLKEAEQLATAALEMRRRLHPPDHKEIADSLDTLSAVYRLQRDYYTSERRVNEALDMRRRLPPDAASKSDLARSLTNRAILSWRKGELTSTIADLNEAMENHRGTLPDDHLVLGELHYRLAGALEAAGKRGDAIRHYRLALDVRRRHRKEPQDEIADPLRRLGILLREEGQFEAAEKLLLDRDARLRRLNDCPPELRSESHGLLVGLYQAWGRPDQVAPWAQKLQESIAREIADKTARIERTPDKAGPWFERAKARVRAGRFDEAAADYRRGLAIDPSDHWPWFYQGCLLAYLGNEPAYRAHCAEMVLRFGSSGQAHVLDCTVKSCSLLPGAADADRLNQIANQVWSLGGRDERNASWFRLLKGMAEYRAGSPERAINWLTASLTPELPHRAATAELYLAMVRHRLGDAPAARAALASAEARIQRLTPTAGTGDLAEGGIENWLICQTALRECRALVGK